ncbi:MAG: amidohydrolase family protein [Bdellovibrio bacteriovorus]
MPLPRPIFDGHLHIIDPRFPLVANQGYLPDTFTVADYQRALVRLGLDAKQLVGGALVSGSFQGFDQTYLVEALQALGAGFVGVTQLPVDVPDTEIRRLHGFGVRALRFNLRRGPDLRLESLDRLARRAFDLAGWHLELYVDGADLPTLTPLLSRLPSVVIDHLGLSRAGLPHLLALVARGVRVKASGFGRLDFDPGPVLRAIHRENPGALLFGSDLPGTRAPRPIQPGDLALIAEALGDAQALDLVLRDNAVALYRPSHPERR